MCFFFTFNICKCYIISMKENSSIKGNVVKILYESRTGYKVGLFKVKEANGSLVTAYLNKTITFTGNFMPINNELTYLFTGYIVNHPRFGVQFNVTSYESVIPDTIDGIVMYLSSGIFKGIGPKTAKEIVKVFKEETINEIKNANPYLSKIKGMNEKKANDLIKKINEYDKNQEIIIEFNKLGFTTEECLKIINKYKNRSYEILQNNIYVLEEDINFLKLDKVFLSMHDEKDNIRIDALIKYNIKSLCYKTGDTLVSKESLYVEMNKFFTENIDSNLFLSHINDLICEKSVIEVDDYLTLDIFYSTERKIANIIKNLSKIKEDISEKRIDIEIENYEKCYDIHFSPTQRDAIKKAIINNVFIITGGPGTGKTTIINAVVSIYETINDTLEKKDITLLAPTGRASKRISESTKRNASTIHKFLKWNKETQEFSVNRFNPSDTKLVIIDEVSMVDIFLMFNLLDALKNNVKLILVGDAFQLPSIAPGNILNDLILSNVNNVFLTDVYRTSLDSYIIPLSTEIKNRQILKEIPNNYKDFKFIEASDIYIKNYLKELILKAKEKNLDLDNFQVLIPMYKGENGIDNLNKLMQSVFNEESENKKEILIRDTIYRENDKVIQLVNDVENNIFNGDVGYIKRIILGKNPIIEINYNGNVVVYNRGKFDEFTHAYAISVHKSQGSEYDTVILVIPSNMKRMLYNKLLYTAVTRAKKGLVIVGSLEIFIVKIDLLL